MPPSTTSMPGTWKSTLPLAVFFALASCSPTGGPEPIPDAGGPQGPGTPGSSAVPFDQVAFAVSADIDVPIEQTPTLVGTGGVTSSAEEFFPPGQSLRTYSLKERFLGGQRLRRQLRVERRFQLRYDTSLPAQVQGSSELVREYTVNVEEASVGQILRATVDVVSDTRRVLPVGDVRPRLAVSAGPLIGTRLTCQLAASGRYQCTAPGAIGPVRDLGGIAPQRIGMWPGKMISMTGSWELRGRDAEIFLEAEGVEAVVRFILEDPNAAYRDEDCRRVAYSIDGTQQIAFGGTATQASLTGQGEFYYCQDQSAVLFHTQERNLSMQIPVNRGLETGMLEREMTVIMEEETNIER